MLPGADNLVPILPAVCCNHRTSERTLSQDEPPFLATSPISLSCIATEQHFPSENRSLFDLDHRFV
jgi:hypothetical protein